MLNPINRSPSSPYDARMYVQQEQIEEEKKNKLRRNDATFDILLSLKEEDSLFLRLRFLILRP